MASEVECITCTVVGGGAFTGIGAYALLSSRPKAIGSPLGKGIIGLMGGVFLILGVNRLLPLRNARRISDDPTDNCTRSGMPRDHPR